MRNPFDRLGNQWFLWFLHNLGSSLLITLILIPLLHLIKQTNGNVLLRGLPFAWQSETCVQELCATSFFTLNFMLSFLFWWIVLFAFLFYLTHSNLRTNKTV